VLSYGFFHERYPTWLPGSVILEELNACEITYSDKAICLMNCSNISKQAIGEILAEGEVIFSKSEVHAEPCPSYLLEGETKGGRFLGVVFTKCDSVAEVTSSFVLDEERNCECD